MMYLIEHLSGWLAIVAVLGAVSGWGFHVARAGGHVARLERDRDRLRNELIAVAVGGLPTGDGPQTLEAERENEILRTRLDISLARIKELEGEMLAMRDQRESAVSQSADLQRRLAAPSAQSTAADPGEADPAERAAFWRARYFEARTGVLEALLAERATSQDEGAQEASALLGPPQEEPRHGSLPADAALLAAAAQALRARVADLEADLDGERARADALLAAPALNAPGEALKEENNRLSWQARYLAARVGYLEGLERARSAEVPASPTGPEETEEERRAYWRLRYLEARVQHLQSLPAEAAPAAMAEPSPAAEPVEDPRIAEMEALLVEASRETELAFAEIGLKDQRIAELSSQVSEAARAAEAAREEARSRRETIVQLEASLAKAAGFESELAQVREHAVQLEAALEAARAPDPEMAKLRWRARYFDARVAYLEQALAATLAPPVEAAAPAGAASSPSQARDEPLVPVAAQRAGDEPAPAVAPGYEVRPEALPAPRSGVPDDLRLIDGIGPKIESTLNSLGVYHFDQIAAWAPAHIAWVDQYLRLRGRIDRENWVAQASRLASEVTTGAFADAMEDASI